MCGGFRGFLAPAALFGPATRGGIHGRGNPEGGTRTVLVHHGKFLARSSGFHYTYGIFLVMDCAGGRGSGRRKDFGCRS